MPQVTMVVVAGHDLVIYDNCTENRAIRETAINGIAWTDNSHLVVLVVTVLQ